MDENRRTKILAAGLAGVVAIYGLRSTIDGMVMKPIRDQQTKLRAAEFESESLAAQKIQLQVAQRNLEDWKQISLPPNVDDAQRLYREWIFALTRQCGFSGSGFEVTPGSRSPQKEYSTVAVDVKKAETDLQGLTRFLFLFDQAGILHRISDMKIDSPGAQGNPRLSVSFTAEGMSVAGSEDKKELLPRTQLTTKLSDSSTELTVLPNELFPTWSPFEPFLVRIDRELVRVTSVSDSAWKVERGIDGTKAASHDLDAIVELLPVLWDRREKTLAQYEEFVKNSVFVIPSPPKTWNPRLSGVSDKTIKPGEEVRFTARAESFNPELGEPMFALADAAEGMQIDPATGTFEWKPSDSVPPGKYDATVLLTQSGNESVKLSSKLTITIRQLNEPPALLIPESAIIVIGREFAVTASATDDGPPQSLKYSLGTGAPEGLTIDPVTGVLKWTPERSFTPGKYEVEVKVTDSGEEPKTTSKKMSLDVRDDHAALTLLSAAVSKDNVWIAWFRNKGTGKTERLKVGEILAVSEIQAEIVNISNRFVMLKDSEGVWKLALGDVIRDRTLVEPAKDGDALQSAISPVEQAPSDLLQDAPTAEDAEEQVPETSP